MPVPRSERNQSRGRPAQDSSPSVNFGPSDIRRLSDPHAQLNDICLNDGAILLRDHYQAHCALFSSYDITNVRTGSIEMLKRSSKRSRYWEYDIWMIPIHHPAHWTLAVVVLSAHTIYQFDSFASHDTWQADVDVRHDTASLTFITLI